MGRAKADIRKANREHAKIKTISMFIFPSKYLHIGTAQPVHRLYASAEKALATRVYHVEMGTVSWSQ